MIGLLISILINVRRCIKVKLKMASVLDAIDVLFLFILPNVVVQLPQLLLQLELEPVGFDALSEPLHVVGLVCVHMERRIRVTLRDQVEAGIR